MPIFSSELLYYRSSLQWIKNLLRILEKRKDEDGAGVRRRRQVAFS
jgi:hypothetical protein